jgi:hypothetical protein
MTRTTPAQRSFSSGEIAPLLHRRSDYQRFQTGLARCRGFVPLRQGGFTRAPGTLFRGYTRENAQSILVPFVFASDDALVLEFSPGKLRFWRYGALIEKDGAPYEIASPYGADDLPNVQWVQSADVVYLADGAHPIHKLSRLALDNWTIAPAVFDTGPFRVQNLDEALTLSASAETGTVTLTASAAFFEADHVGTLFRLEGEDYSDVPLWVGNAAASVGDLARSDGNIYELIAGTNTGISPPLHRSGDQNTDPTTGTIWRFISDGVGVVRITAIASATEATATVLKRIPAAAVDTPTYRWSEGAWSDRHGWPALIEVYDQRLVAAATPTEPRTVWFSVLGSFEDFTPGIEADDAFAFAIAGSDNQNRILWLRAGKRGLHIGAASEEYSTRSETRAQVIGPTTARFGKDSGIGGRPVRPIAPDGNPIFVARDGRRLYEISYIIEQDGNIATELSLPSSHLGAPGIEQIAWQSAPERQAWMRLGNGDIAAMIHDPREDVLGWAVVPLAGGVCEALAVTPSSGGERDIILMIVRRLIGQQVVRMVEEMAIGFCHCEAPAAAAVHFFASMAFHLEAPSASFSLPHLASAEVQAWTDQGNFGPFTVGEDGELTLPVPVTRGCIGLFDQTHMAETLDIQAATPNGDSMGRKKRVQPNLGIALYRTTQGKVSVVERSLGRPDRVNASAWLVPMGVPTVLNDAFSGVGKISIAGGQAEETALRITPFGGAPLTVLALVPHIQEGGQ